MSGGCRAFLLACSLGLVGANHVAAETPADGDPDHWEFLIAPYFMAPSMDGTTTVKGLTADVAADAGEIFDHLQFGAMVYMEAHNSTWAVSLDVLYMDLGQDGTTQFGTYDIGMEQTGIMLAGYRRVMPGLEFLVAAQLNSLSASLNTTGPVGIETSDDKTWVDPHMGLRLTVPNTEKWRFTLLANIGGFGVGSEMAWQVYPTVGYRISKLVEVGVAYRVIYMDYRTGSGNDEFRYDMKTYGPELGVGLHF